MLKIAALLLLLAPSARAWEPIEVFDGGDVADISPGNFQAGSWAFPSNSTVTVSGTGTKCFSVDDPTLVVNCRDNRVGIGTADPRAALDVSGTVQIGTGTAKSTFTAAGLLDIPASAGANVGGLRLGAVEGRSPGGVNNLVQFSSAAVTGSLTFTFAGVGLRACGVAPYVLTTTVFDSDGDTAIHCNPHTISSTGMTIECVQSNGDGLGADHTPDAVERQVNYILICPSP